MRRASTMPWLRLDATFTRDAKLRKARATAVWPAVIGRMKAGLGFVSDDDLDAEILAEELFLPVDLVAAAVEGLKRVGLLVWGEDEVEVGGRVRSVRRVSGWTTPNWCDYQPDGRPRNDKREDGAEAADPNGPRDGSPEANGPRDGSSEANGPRDGSQEDNRPRDGTPRDVTGRDVTGQDHKIENREESVTPQGRPEGVPGTTPPAPAAPEPVEPAAVEAMPVEAHEAKAKRQVLDEAAGRVYAVWVAVMGKTGAAAKRSSAQGQKRLAMLRARLADGYTEAQIVAAVRGCAASPWHQGENPEGRRYDDLELICRPGKVDGFIALGTDPRPAGPRSTPPPLVRPVAQAGINARWAGRSVAPAAQQEVADDCPF